MYIDINGVWEHIAPQAVKYSLLAFVIIADFVTGLFEAIKEKNFQSSKMRQGLSHKVSEVGTAVFGEVIDAVANFSGTELPVDFSTMIVTYIVLMEIGSIAENLGFVLPETITRYLPNSKTKTE